MASRMLVTFINGAILGWLADRNDEQSLDALDGFIEQLAAFAEPPPARARPSSLSAVSPCAVTERSPGILNDLLSATTPAVPRRTDRLWRSQ